MVSIEGTGVPLDIFQLAVSPREVQGGESGVSGSTAELNPAVILVQRGTVPARSIYTITHYTFFPPGFIKGAN